MIYLRDFTQQQYTILEGFDIFEAPLVAVELPTIENQGILNLYVNQGEVFTTPSWEWSDDLSTGNAVEWTGSVDTSTPGMYEITASATNDVGTTTLTVRVYVRSTAINLPDFIPRLLATDVKTVTVFTGLENWVGVQISYDGVPIDLTRFIQLELHGLTNQPISSYDYPNFFRAQNDGMLYIDVGLIDVEDLKTRSGVIKTILIGRTLEDIEGVMLWHPYLENSRVSMNIVPL